MIYILVGKDKSMTYSLPLYILHCTTTCFQLLVLRDDAQDAVYLIELERVLKLNVYENTCIKS